MVLRILVIIALVVAIQAAGSLFLVNKSLLISEVAAAQYLNQPQSGGTNNAADEDVIERLDDSWARTEMIIALVIFALFFIVGVYWWTYGKLHHKVPRY